jgi:hypothetical protein
MPATDYLSAALVTNKFYDMVTQEGADDEGGLLRRRQVWKPGESDAM